MTVFIELTVDQFQEEFNTQTGSRKTEGHRTRRAGAENVRRPLRGLEVKDDTYAIIKVLRPDGNEIPLFDAGGDARGRSTQYANFLLQNVQEARMEKNQIVETFGEPYIFFFGEAPRFIDVTAVLINSTDFNWRAEWWENYDKYLRGTKLVEMGARMYLFYDDIIIEGYMLQSSVTDTADLTMALQMNFRFFVTNYANISFLGDPTYPTRGNAVLPNGIDLTAADSVSRLNVKQPTALPNLDQAMGQLSVELLKLQATSQVQQEIAKISSTQDWLNYQKQTAVSTLSDTISQLSDKGPGGTQTIVQMLQQGIYFSSYPGQNLDEFLRNVSLMVYNDPVPPPEVIRNTPIRGNIQDNYDEYTQSDKWGGAAFGQRFNLPVNGPAPDPIGTINKEACKRGASLGPSNFFGFGLVPGGGLGGTLGAGFSASAGAGLNSQAGFGVSAGAGISTGLGGGLQTSSYSGTGYGYQASYNRSYGYTAGVGGSYGGQMGGAIGPGVGGAIGGYGAAQYGNPSFQQFGSPMQQQFSQNRFGLATGTPYGLPVGSGGPQTATVYQYTAGIRPDGSTYSGSTTSQVPLNGVAPIPGSAGYVSAPPGFAVPGYTKTVAPGLSAGYTSGFGTGVGGSFSAGASATFGGGANFSAIAGMGAGIRGDGVFGMQAVPGTLDPTLQGSGKPCPA